MIIYDFATPYSYYTPLFLSCLPPSPFSPFLFSLFLSFPVLSPLMFCHPAYFFLLPLWVLLLLFAPCLLFSFRPSPIVAAS